MTSQVSAARESALPRLLVRKRDGRVVPFDPVRIQAAMAKAFQAESGTTDDTLDANFRADIRAICDLVAAQATKLGTDTPHGVEWIQDCVEEGLMQRAHFDVARCYILYRSQQARLRAARNPNAETTTGDEQKAVAATTPRIRVETEPGITTELDQPRLIQFLTRLAELADVAERDVNIGELADEVVRGSFDGMTTSDIARLLVLAARSRIERDPAYDRLTAQLQLAILYREALGCTQQHPDFVETYHQGFAKYIATGIQHDRLSGDLRQFDLEQLAEELRPERDRQFRYLGVQAIYDRYLLHVDQRRIETPQYFWMRVAMGLAIAEPEPDRNRRAIEFYQLLSQFRFCSATPTLFNAGTPHPQLSSCYLSTVPDDLQQIFRSIADNAQLSKWAGGLGNDWTPVRATGARITGTGGTSQGVIPFLKVVNDAAVAVNQGGKRKGAVCAYLEPWHLDFEEFLDLRKNTGDDRRRTHDMHTAAWIPDLFMQRVAANSTWTLFSPDDAPDLHDSYGADFRQRYEQYEQLADEGRIKLFRRVRAVDLWRKLLTRAFETGHPWITFKDAANVRSPQDHAGVVHSSNLCTEILLNTSDEETAVCNLGSINLVAHIRDGQLDHTLLQDTVKTAMRMLDNVIDINFYPTPEAKTANLRHRPVGLGMMGYQDALQKMGICFASEEAVAFADSSTEAISYYALHASTELAAERGAYSTFAGSKWDRGLLPIDTIDLLEQERGETIEVDRNTTLPWETLRDAIQTHGMRNSNCLAIAPTATISTIIGVNQSIEPAYKHLYVKSNLSGEFIQVNADLVATLKQRGLWRPAMLDELKYHDGALGEMPSIPDDIKALFPCAFEIEPHWMIQAAARRQKWLDQGMSLNLYVAQPSGKAIDAMYTQAWRAGLKTTYYLRSLAATQVEKSTLDVNRHGIQPRWMKSTSQSGQIRIDRGAATQLSCSLDDAECEACQ